MESHCFPVVFVQLRGPGSTRSIINIKNWGKKKKKDIKYFSCFFILVEKMQEVRFPLFSHYRP